MQLRPYCAPGVTEMAEQPPKTGAARRLWDMSDEEVAERFGQIGDDRGRDSEDGHV